MIRKTKYQSNIKHISSCPPAGFFYHMFVREKNRVKLTKVNSFICNQLTINDLWKIKYQPTVNKKSGFSGNLPVFVNYFDTGKPILTFIRQGFGFWDLKSGFWGLQNFFFLLAFYFLLLT